MRCFRVYVQPLRVTVTRIDGLDSQVTPATDLSQAALDALPAHIAILDKTGKIVTVNAAWRGFGAANELWLINDGGGANYLADCQCAVEPGDVHATSIVLGMLSVSSGAGCLCLR